MCFAENTMMVLQLLVLTLLPRHFEHLSPAAKY
jgi:hypothetical protein